MADDTPVVASLAPVGQKAEVQPAVLIKYVGKRFPFNKEAGMPSTESKSIPDDEIPTWRRDGMTIIELPDGATQKAGFLHEHAGLLLRGWPDEFKLLREKG